MSAVIKALPGTAGGSATIVPAMRYEDAPAAVDWLCRAFGFEKHLVVPGKAGEILHAQLRFGNGMVMLGSASRENEYGRYVKSPAAAGGVGTQGVYVVVPDADAHYRRAVGAGARIVIDLRDEDYGGRGYTCRDPEGHVWSFGTYDPWIEDPS
jgi:uncharacterized glyoxalase superfamily protein PhnB